jgi:hypothetical protein
VFFPSYTVMNVCMESWDRTRQGSSLSIMESIQRIKHTVRAPKAILSTCQV